MKLYKTLLISEIFPPKVGGSGRWFWEIYSRLVPERYIIAVGLDHNSHEFDMTHSCNCMRWPLSIGNCGVTSFSSIKFYIKLFFLLRAAVKTYQINFIHCGRGLPEGLLGWLGKKWFEIPYLCYVHGEELPSYRSSREYKFLSQLVYENAHGIIVNSENTRKLFVMHTGIENTVRMLHPGADTTYFTPSARNEDILRQLNWSGRKVVLTVGRLQQRKGHDNVILAIKHIRMLIPNVLYAIVGDGEERARLEHLVATENACNYVQFLGQVDDATVLNCYQQCDLFVLANREVNNDFEGFGMVLIEAQACGKPVITGKSGGTVETMIPGETGIIINADKIDHITQAIVQLLSDKTRSTEMGSRGAEWVRENFDWTALTVKIESLFAEFQN